MAELNPIGLHPGYECQPRRTLMADLDPTGEIQLLLKNRIAELKAMISRVPRVPKSIKKHHLQSYGDSPFAEEICMIEMLSHFTYPTIKMYDGNGDPDNHIGQYKQRMHTCVVHQFQREACICKGFGSSLANPTVQWFVNLPNESISSFAKLHNPLSRISLVVGKLRRDWMICMLLKNTTTNHSGSTLQDSIGKKSPSPTVIKK